MKIYLIAGNPEFPATKSLFELLTSISEVKLNFIKYVDYSSRCPFLLKPVGFLLSECLMFVKVFHRKLLGDIFVIYDAYLPLTLIAIRLLRRKSILIIGSSSLREKMAGGHRVFAWLGHFTQILSYYLADRLVIFGKHMVGWTYADKFKCKIRIAPQPITYKLVRNFYLEKPYRDRETVVGYVGALERHKGFNLLVDSINHISTGANNNSITFLLIGKGKEKENVKKSKRFIRYIGFIPHTSLRKYYNEMKLLVLPSYTEGLPAVILEAMACGTPVLATPVGAIPDVIEEGKTGFLLKSNDPKHIAERIIELLNKPDLLEKVSINAYNYVKGNFSYEKVLEAWRKIISELQFNK